MAQQDTSEERSASEVSVEDSPFVDLLGDSARAKVLATMIEAGERELTASEVGDRTGTADHWVRKNLRTLVAYGVVRETRTIGGAQLYQLDPESEVADRFGDLHGAVLESAEAVQPDPA